MREDALVELSIKIKPFVPIPSAIKEYLEKNLSKSRIEYSTEHWFCYSLFLGLLSFLVLLGMFGILFGMLGISFSKLMGISLGASLVIFGMTLLEPSKDRRKYAEEFETDMGLALLVLSIDISSGRRFRQCLERVSTGYGYFSKEIERALLEERAGNSIIDSLDRISNSIDSIIVKQGIVALKSAYKFPNGESIRSVAENILKGNENALKEHGSKSGMILQASTVFTVVFPTILICLLMIGMLIYSPKIHPWVLSIGIGFGFTIASMGFYQYQISTVPVFVRRLHSKKREKLKREIEKALFVLGYKMDVQKYITIGICLSFLSFAVAFLLGFASGNFGIKNFAISVICGGFVGMAFILYPGFQYASVLKDIEDSLPLVLEQAAQFSENRTERIVEMISNLELGRISQEFGKSSKEIRAGGTVEEALAKIYRDTGSDLVRRALNLLVDAHRSGINMQQAFKDTAEYIRNVKYLVQEARSATASERITQLAGFFIAAGLFGVVVSMGGGMIGLLNGTFFNVDVKMISTLILGIQLNLLVQPFAISYSVSKLEGNPKKMLFYLPLLLIGGNLLFSFTRGFSII
ncbi:type II secretion system F family protein [Candidatus Undinarchaeota archaeon]